MKWKSFQYSINTEVNSIKPWVFNSRSRIFYEFEAYSNSSYNFILEFAFQFPFKCSGMVRLIT